MCKKVFLFILLFFLSLPLVVGGENITIHSDPVINESVKVSDDVSYALEDGHFNTSFSDGFNGYCLEYGEEEAKTGDKFYDNPTTYLNHEDEDIGNYLKLYYTDFNGAEYDKVVTQHLIWHFSDGFDGWRVNHTLVENIKELSQTKKISDKYSVQLNSTHMRVFYFKVLLSPYEYRQDYFAYKILIEEILDNGLDGNVSGDNVTNNFSNIIFNETIHMSLVEVDNSVTEDDLEKENRVNKISNPLNKHVTGKVLFNAFIILILVIVMLSGIQLMNKYWRK